jgi:hypothetical protein
METLGFEDALYSQKGRWRAQLKPKLYAYYDPDCLRDVNICINKIKNIETFTSKIEKPFIKIISVIFLIIAYLILNNR